MSVQKSSKSLDLYSTIFEAAPSLCKLMFPSEEFLASKADSMRDIEMDFFLESEKYPDCTKNPYLLKDMNLNYNIEKLRAKIVELC